MFKGAVCRILGLAALMLGPSLAHAGLIQQTQSFNLTSSGSVSGYYNSYSSTNSRTANLLFDGFDSSLGLLTGVELSFTSSFSMGGNGGASDSRPYTHYERYRVKVSDFGCGLFWLSPCYETRYRSYYSNDVSYSATANATLGMTLLQPAATGLVKTGSAFTSCYDGGYTYYSSCSAALATGGVFNGALDLSGISLAAFEDDLRLALSAQQLLRVYCGHEDSCSLSSTLNWGGTVTLAYSYELVIPDPDPDPTPDPTPDPINVPAPAPLLLLALGLLGLGFSRRR
ncbi:MAG: hypothetical protein II007_10435 [Gammaproteobacteria bacterium]|nr:hypothetical protein [Gammaproteobacteria bacterium]